jgi:hypothetical protein
VIKYAIKKLGLKKFHVSGYIGQKIRVYRSAKNFFQIFFTAQILVKINTFAVEYTRQLQINAIFFEKRSNYDKIFRVGSKNFGFDPNPRVGRVTGIIDLFLTP